MASTTRVLAPPLPCLTTLGPTSTFQVTSSACIKTSNEILVNHRRSLQDTGLPRIIITCPLGWDTIHSGPCVQPVYPSITTIALSVQRPITAKSCLKSSIRTTKSKTLKWTDDITPSTNHSIGTYNHEHLLTMYATYPDDAEYANTSYRLALEKSYKLKFADRIARQQARLCDHDGNCERKRREVLGRLRAQEAREQELKRDYDAYINERIEKTFRCTVRVMEVIEEEVEV